MNISILFWNNIVAYNLDNTLVIGITSTALFNMAESDQIFRELVENDPNSAVELYRKYMLEQEDEDLPKGTGFPLIKALLGLNQYKKPDDQSPLVEVVVMSRNSADTGIMVLNNIRKNQLNITRSVFSAGKSVVDYLQAFKVDLFLTTNTQDAQWVRHSDVCAVAILKKPPSEMGALPEDHVRIAFDGDAVLFDDSSELVYKTLGLDEFHKRENEKQDEPLSEGPYAVLLKKLSSLQQRLPFKPDFSPIRIALVTARNSPSDIRVIKTLRHWGVYVDEAFFLGGIAKTEVLKAFKPHIFFDDQDTHLDLASEFINSARVPYTSASPLNPTNFKVIKKESNRI